MPFDGDIRTMTHTEHQAELLTSTAALALWDDATNQADKVRAGAAMAHILRTMPAPKAKAAPRAKADATTGPEPLNAKSLAAALRRVCALVERKNTIPILSNVLLIARAGRLTIVGTDLDMEYTEYLTDCPELGKFSICAPAHELLAALKGAAGGVMISVAENDTVTLTAGGSDTRFKGLPAGDFPVMAFAPTADMVMNGAALVSALGFVQAAISDEATRYYLNGAYMHSTGMPGDASKAPALAFVATDGHRMMFTREEGLDMPAGVPGCIIPRKAVGWMVNHIPKDDCIVEFDVMEGVAKGIRITTDRGVMTTKVIDGSFPDYCRVIPAPNPEGEALRMTWGLAKEAIATITRLRAVSKEKSRSIKLFIGDGELHGEIKNMEGSKASGAIPGVVVAKSSAKFEAGFNSSYLMDVLAHGEPIHMVMANPAAACRFEWPNQPHRIGVIMPLRV